MLDVTRYSTPERYMQRGVHARANISPSRPRSVEIYVALLILLPALVALHRIWAIQAALILLVLSLPGLLLTRALRIPGRVVASYPILVPCASIVVLLFTGLGLDLVGPRVEVSSPLRTVPILVSIEAVCVALVFIAKGSGPDVELPRLALKNSQSLMLPLILPLIAILGAQRLNNGHSNKIALAGTLLCVAVLIVTIFYASRLENLLLTVILFSAALALMYSYSLRGALVYGWDISQEYQRLSMTVATGIWHPAHYNDPYGAMLSLTVMPTELHFLSGISPLMVFKAVYPIFGALFPVEVFAIARRILSPTWSFAAAVVIIAQPGFANGIPALARQEVSLALFGALVAVMLYRPKRRAAQWGLVVLLVLAMVVSHYSTTYIAITIFGVCIILQWVASWFRPTPRFTGTLVFGFIVSLLGVIIWYGPVTHSASGLSAFEQTVSSQGLDLLPTQTPGQGPLSAYLGAGQQTMTASQYQNAVHAQYVLDGSTITPLIDAGEPEYYLKSDSAPTTPIKLDLAHKAINLASLVFQQLLNVLGIIGALLLVVRRKNPWVDRLIGLLGLGVSLFLVLMRLSGTLDTFYGAERALLQGLAVYSITFCWVFERIANRWGSKNNTVLGISKNVVLWIGVLFIGAYFIQTSGLMGAVLGGGTATNLANSGEDYERFSRSAQEVAAATWLGSEVSSGQDVYADRYAQLPLEAVTTWGAATNGNVTPLTIDQNAWVYATTANVVDGRARAGFGIYLVEYAFPAQFLDHNFNIVYSDGASEVFHR